MASPLKVSTPLPLKYSQKRDAKGREGKGGKGRKGGWKGRGWEGEGRKGEGKGGDGEGGNVCALYLPQNPSNAIKLEWCNFRVSTNIVQLIFSNFSFS